MVNISASFVFSSSISAAPAPNKNFLVEKNFSNFPTGPAFGDNNPGIASLYFECVRLNPNVFCIPYVSKPSSPSSPVVTAITESNLNGLSISIPPFDILKTILPTESLSVNLKCACVLPAFVTLSCICWAPCSFVIFVAAINFAFVFSNLFLCCCCLFVKRFFRCNFFLFALCDGFNFLSI